MAEYLEIHVLESILGKGDDRVTKLLDAEPRCGEGISNPCDVCLIKGQIDRTQILNSSRTASRIAEICCPDGKRPSNLESSNSIVKAS